jgi:succinate dehydrogenase / fumarate reductase cytochrome b subunit
LTTDGNPRYRAGLLASLNPLGYNVERWSYTFHRVTGVILIGYLMAHIFETFQLSLGAAAWGNTMAALHSLGPLEMVGLWIVAGSALYHGANGIRLVLNEMFGSLMGKPILPVYPYSPTSLGRNQRTVVWTITVAVLVLWVWAGLYLLAGLGVV